MDRIRQKRISGRSVITPTPFLVQTTIPDTTPGIVSKHVLNRKQASLAKLRYNRLLDIFMGFNCYSLQTSMKAALAGNSQVLIDEVYVGIDKRGRHCILPVLCAGRANKIRIAQVERHLAACTSKFPKLICHFIAAQFMDESRIALFEFDQMSEGPRIVGEKHFQLIRPEHLSPEAWDAHYKAIFN